MVGRSTILDVIRKGFSWENELLRKTIDFLRKRGIKFRLTRSYPPVVKKVVEDAYKKLMSNDHLNEKVSLDIVGSGIELQPYPGLRVYILIVKYDVEGRYGHYVNYLLVPVYIYRGKVVRNTYSTRTNIEDILDHAVNRGRWVVLGNINVDGDLDTTFEETEFEETLIDIVSPSSALMSVSKEDTYSQLRNAFSENSLDKMTLTQSPDGGYLYVVNQMYTRRFPQAAVAFKLTPGNPFKITLDHFFDYLLHKVMPKKALRFRFEGPSQNVDLRNVEKAAKDIYTYAKCTFDAFKNVDTNKVYQFIEKHGLDDLALDVQVKSGRPALGITIEAKDRFDISVGEDRSIHEKSFSYLDVKMSALSKNQTNISNQVNEALIDALPDSVEPVGGEILTIYNSHVKKVYSGATLRFKPNAVSLPSTICNSEKDLYVTRYLAPGLDMTLGAISRLIEEGLI